jgi:hypothetical protein
MGSGTANPGNGGTAGIDETTGIITTSGTINSGGGTWSCTLTDNQIAGTSTRIYVSFNSGITAGATVTVSATATSAGHATIKVVNTGGTQQASGLQINFLVVN